MFVRKEYCRRKTQSVEWLQEEILEEMKKITDGVSDVIVYPNACDKTKNRGFAFVEYESHRAAAMARRKLIPGRIQLWNQQIAVDWAEPEQEVDDDIMSRVGIRLVKRPAKRCL